MGSHATGPTLGRPQLCEHPVSDQAKGANQHARYVHCRRCGARLFYEPRKLEREVKQEARQG
eukprot:7716536-Lingulodinium_polyedra.AAC.1